MDANMFGDLDWPLNASRGLSAIAEFLVQTSYPINQSQTSKVLLHFVQKLQNCTLTFIPQCKNHGFG